MNRTLKEATVKRCYYRSHENELKKHLHTFLMAYTFAKRLKILKGLTACEYIRKIRTKEPERFKINPIHHTVGLGSGLIIVISKIYDRLLPFNPLFYKAREEAPWVTALICGNVS
jgi:hypothetical protein